MKRILFLFLTVSVLAAIAWFFLGRRLAVETVRVSKGDLVRTVEEDGTVEAPDDRKIFATQLARVLEVPVEDGDAVRQGQILVRMKNPDLDVNVQETRTLLEKATKELRGAEARVESARLLLEDAVRNAARWERLYEAGGISLSELEGARLAEGRSREDFLEARSAEASASALESGLRRTLSELRAKGGELVVKSPIKGVVLELPAEKDKVLQPGDLVVTVAPEARMEVVSDVLSDALGGVAVGQKVRVTAPILGDRILEGRVFKIYPQAFEKLSALGVVQRRVKVKVRLPFEPQLKPGFEVRVAIETERRSDVLLLPVEAVRTTEDGRRLVRRIEGNRVQSGEVTTGLTDRRFLEILGGIGEGDEVLRDAGLDIEDGARVKKADDSR
ncbi:MAG: efflux RND transporter periplasmic adaptor subunit [Synergistales bacterium]